MNHTFVKAGVDNSFQSDFQYMQRNYPNIEIVLGEVGRYTDSQNSVDPSEGIFGSALWTADYLLYTMSLVSPNKFYDQTSTTLTPAALAERHKSQYAVK